MLNILIVVCILILDIVKLYVVDKFKLNVYGVWFVVLWLCFL